MIPYWILFLVPSFAASQTVSAYSMKRRDDSTWVMAVVFLTLFIGLRYDVGGDWRSYVEFYEHALFTSYEEALKKPDPSYWLINVVSAKLGLGLTGVNLISGFIFSVGLCSFCHSLPRPWLALAVAVPYMVIVVSMGYTRQSVALGFVMMGLVALGRQKLIWFVVLILLGATFHKSAVLLLPLAALTKSRSWILSVFISLFAVILGYNVLLEEEVNVLIKNYIEEEYQSSGAFIRLMMNVVPSALFIYLHKNVELAMSDRVMWLMIAFISIGIFVLYFFTNASTALDRVALYCIPLQLKVFSHLPDMLKKYRISRLFTIYTTLMYYGSVLFVWLNFADNARFWIPYKFGA